MIRDKRLYLLLALIAIPVIALFFFFPNTQPEPTPAPTTPVTPRPTGSTTGASKVIRVFPPDNSPTVYLPIQQVAITFSEFVPAEDLVIEISPNVNIKQGNDPSDPFTVILSPDPTWETGITFINIRKTGASGKQLLLEDFNYQINSSYPENPDIVH